MVISLTPVLMVRRTKTCPACGLSAPELRAFLVSLAPEPAATRAGSVVFERSLEESLLRQAG